MKARDVMSRRVVTVAEGATLAEAARAMWDRNCGFLPVTESATGRICGVITDRDICMGALTQGRPIHQIPVSVSMSRDVAACSEGDDLREVERRLREHRVRRLPVVDSGHRCVGVVSIDDLAKACLDPAAGRAALELKRDVARTLGLIATPEPAQALQSACL